MEIAGAFSMEETKTKTAESRMIMATCKLGKNGCWKDGKCRHHQYCENKVLTKADRIRAMSDEELATDLLSVFEEICEDGVPGKDWMLHWLKQPAEEGDGNG